MYLMYTGNRRPARSLYESWEGSDIMYMRTPSAYEWKFVAEAIPGGGKWGGGTFSVNVGAEGLVDKLHVFHVATWYSE